MISSHAKCHPLLGAENPINQHAGIPTGPGRVEITQSYGGEKGPFLFLAGTRDYSGAIAMDAYPRADYSFLRWWIYGAPEPNNIGWCAYQKSYTFSAPLPLLRRISLAFRGQWERVSIWALMSTISPL